MAPLTRSDRLIVRYSRWVIANRYLVMFASLVVVLLAGLGLRNLNFHDDYRAYFDEGNPQLQALLDLQDTYTRSNNVLFVIAPASGEVFDRPTLTAVLDVTERAWQLPFATRVDSITNFQHMVADGDDLSVDDLIADLDGMTDADLRRAREVAVSEPALVHRIVSADAAVTAVNVIFTLPEVEHDENSVVAAAVRELKREMADRHAGVDIYLTGLVMLDAAFLEASLHDIFALVPIMVVVIVAMMLLLLRSFWGMVVALSLVGVSLITGEGLAGWAGLELTPPSAGSFSMIMTLAVADSVHILVTLFAGMRAGLSKEDALVESLRVNMQPVFLTSVTTAIGFLVMNFGDSPPFRDLGNITATGVTAAFLFAVTFTPALIMMLPIKAPRRRDFITPWTGRIGEFVIARRRPVLLGVLVAAVAILSMVPRNELDDQFIEYFSPAVEFRTDTEFTARNLTGIYQIHYSLSSGRDNGVGDPAFLDRAERVAVWLRNQPEVLHVSSITDVIKRLNRSMHGDDPDWHRLPDDSALAAQYLLFYEMSMPFGLDLNNQLNVDKSATQLVATLRNVSSNEVRALAKRGNQWLAANTPQIASEAVGGSLIFAEVSRRTINNMLFGTFVGLLLISALLIGALRDLRLGLISIAPNLLPSMLALGLWGLFVAEINMAVSVIVAMTLGIVVDDTVHFLSKYKRARRERRLDPDEAVRHAFRTVAGALVTTSMILCSGFAVLMLSTFRVNSVTATLVVTTLVIALIIDFLLLPARIIISKPLASTGHSLIIFL